MIDDERTLSELLRIAARAADTIARIYTTDFSVDYKSAHDPVTLADREANGIICEELGKAFPGVPVVAEESDPATYASFGDASAVFFVDPLDGTRDFVKKNGEFAVMIGFADQGRATLGVIHAPATHRSFAGGAQAPAFESMPDGSRRPLRVSEVRDFREARLVVSRSRPSEELMAIADQLGLANVSSLGSAGLKGLKVACAEAEIYGHLGQAGWRWDSCAPEAIALGAGGTTSDAQGGALDYRLPNLQNDRGLLITNGYLHEPMLAALRRVLPPPGSP